MNKQQKAKAAFRNIEKLYPQLRRSAERSKPNGLWHLESVIRGQIRRLSALPSQPPGYQAIYNQYSVLLDEVSRQLLAQYNQKHSTNYAFDTIVYGKSMEYHKSGIISVLLAHHIPQMVTAQFRRLLPACPQDEFSEARSRKRKFYLHLGDTNTGKTYHALQRLKQSASGIYLAPLRILALENYERLNREGVLCSLLTGEEEIQVPGAQHLCCTVEKANLSRRYDIAVIDEAQLVGDSQRGDAWTRAILGLCCPEIHLCGALSAGEQLLAMIRDCGDDYTLKEYRRLVPLQVQRRRVHLSAIEKGDALVTFSKRGVLALSRFFADRGIRNSVIYGDLPPEVRRRQYNAFIRGESPILVSTDAIGMGINLPIRRLIFTQIEKFDGESRRLLTSQEIKQIAGRAGRIGIYDIGYVACLDDDIDYVEAMLLAEDEPVHQAVVGPSEAIMQIDLLPLRDKLALWSTEPEMLSYYRKKDIRNELLILDLLQPYNLPENLQWRLMQIPFDPGNDMLLARFSSYLEECFSQKAAELLKPVSVCHSCAELETYYQEVNLYYSFSKTMDLPIDESWIFKARLQISEKIQKILEKSNIPGMSDSNVMQERHAKQKHPNSRND